MTPAKKDRLLARTRSAAGFILKAKQAINVNARAEAVNAALTDLAVVVSALVEEVEGKK